MAISKSGCWAEQLTDPDYVPPHRNHGFISSASRCRFRPRVRSASWSALLYAWAGSWASCPSSVSGCFPWACWCSPSILRRCVDSGGAWRSGGAGADKSSAALSKKRGPNLHPAPRRFVAAKKRGPDLHRALRHWVMVGCLQGKTHASYPYKVKNWLTDELVLDLTANDS